MKPRLSAIIKAAATAGGVPSEWIVGASRDQYAVMMRAAVTVVAAGAGHSGAAIGRALQRDHTTILALRRGWATRDVTAAMADRIRAVLEGRSPGDNDVDGDDGSPIVVDLAALVSHACYATGSSERWVRDDQGVDARRLRMAIYQVARAFPRGTVTRVTGIVAHNVTARDAKHVKVLANKIMARVATYQQARPVRLPDSNVEGVHAWRGHA